MDALDLSPGMLAALRRVGLSPVDRDGSENPIAYGLATKMLCLGLIRPGVRRSDGPVAGMSWRVWEITPLGQRVLDGGALA